MDKASQPTNLNEDIILRAWDDDESVLGQLVLDDAGTLERAIANEFRRLSAEEVADVIAEAIKRFWEWRHKFDGQRSIRACLYRIANNVASELVSGRLKWQKSRNLESSVDQAQFEEYQDNSDSRLDEIEIKHPQICDDLYQVIQQLSEIQQAVIWAYGLAGDFELDASDLGRELGKKYKNGVPIPAGTIRQHKKRAKDTITSEMKKRGYDLERLGVGK